MSVTMNVYDVEDSMTKTHYGHNIDITDDNEFVCTDCEELI